MIRSIWNSRSGMASQMDKLNAISNNMANVNTIGYKRVDVNFNDLMQETFDRTGYPVERGKANSPFTGSGVKSSGIQMDNSQGNLNETGSKTDLALDGKGFFKVMDGNGKEAYTRGGSFTIDSYGTIADSNGNRIVILDENNNNVNLPGIGFTKENFKVDQEGNILGREDSLRIPIYNTIGDNSMKSIGENLYLPETIIDQNGNGTQVDVVENKDVDILQGFVERSNVDLAQEMTDMIVTQRAFQLNSSALKAADEMWQMANNLKGR